MPGRQPCSWWWLGYGLTFAVGMITGGRLGDQYGRRRMFTVGLALFTMSSAACGLAPSATALVVARVLQGAAAALLTPQVLAILGTVYAGPRRARAFAAYGVAMGLAGVLGQLVGGAVMEADLAGSGWRGIFLINVPVGLVGLALVGGTVPESRGLSSRIDVLGTLLVVLGLAAVVLPLTEGQQHGWPAWTWMSLVAAPGLLAVFVWNQARSRRAGGSPLLDLGLFANRAFSAGLVAALTFTAVPPSFFFVLALYLQQARGLGPLPSGVIFVAAGVGYFVAIVAGAAMAARLGRQVLALGAVVVALGCLDLALEADTSSTVALLPGLAFVGFGIGAVLVPLSSTVLRDVPAVQAGSASGVLSTAFQVGGALGVAVVGVVFFQTLGAGDYPHAFRLSVLALVALAVPSMAAVQFLPRHGRSRST